MIERETIDRVLEAADIVDVVSDFVSLRRRGANYIACCPFHNEKTPSFSVSPAKGIFKCFGCGKAGSAVTFVMEHEQMSYVEAIKWLGRKYGIEVNEREETEEDAADRMRRESMTAVSEFAASYYTSSLYNTTEGTSIGLSYFKQRRGFSDETIRKFALGYSPSGRSFAGEQAPETLPQAAARNGYKREFLTATGLCYESGGQLVDKFRERVIFPIHSLSGRIIAFGGRTLKDDKSVAKYLNSPESEIYHKSRSLYGIYFAKSAIAKQGKCYLVEGYTDVISMNQAGIENVVASSGTSLTTEQIRLIHRFTSKVTVLYDGDFAGIKASIRGIDMLLEEGLEIKVVALPDGEDPDSYARSHSAEEIQQFLDSHEVDFIEFKYELLSDSIEKDPIRKGELIREIIRTISVIPDQITRSVYIEQCAGRLGVKQEMLFSEVAAARKKKIESGEYQRQKDELTGRKDYEQPSPASGHTEEPQKPLAIERKSGPAAALDASEREILYYLLKFGEYQMTFEDAQLYGADAPVMNITVSQYISAQLTNDELAFVNPRFAKIYDLYFSTLDEVQKSAAENIDVAVRMDSIMKKLINSEDSSLTPIILDIVVDEHNLNIKEFIKALIPEQNVINKNVPKAVLVYKVKYVEYTYSMLMESLGELQKNSDTEELEATMRQLKFLLQIKKEFLKELNRLQ